MYELAHAKDRNDILHQPAGENAHNTEPNIEQRKWVRDQTSHTRHTTNSAEHGAAAICAPTDSRTGHNIAIDRVKR